MCRLSGGCEMCSLTAAFVTLDSSATAMNARRCLKSMSRESIPVPYVYRSKLVLDSGPIGAQVYADAVWKCLAVSVWVTLAKEGSKCVDGSGCLVLPRACC